MCSLFSYEDPLGIKKNCLVCFVLLFVADIVTSNVFICQTRKTVFTVYQKLWCMCVFDCQPVMYIQYNAWALT